MRRPNARCAVVAMLLLAAAATACGDDDGDAFTFADDELCEWITAEEVTGFFASTYEWDGTGELVDTEHSGPDECWWHLNSAAGDADFEISAGNADPGFLLASDEIVEYQGGPVPAPGGTVSDHPALSEGVIVQSAGWGAYSFWVPPREEYLSLFANRHPSDGTAATGVDSATDETTRVEEQHRFFAFADQLLHELGWVS